MKLSIYTFVKDGLYFDFHVVEMLRHHVRLVDEIVVNEGYSTDGTFEAICDIDPKIRVTRNVWDRSDPSTWYIKFKEDARRECTGDWCILLDCDEFLPEWEIPRIRERLETATELVFPMRYLNFYGNYRVYHGAPEKVHWPQQKWTIHRNREDVEIWGDGSNVRVRGEKMVNKEVYGDAFAEVHHFGFVRNAARLRQKWRTHQKMVDPSKPKWDRTPGFLFDLMPHRWDDPQFLDDLQLYSGDPVQAVRENEAEFVRDGFLVEKLVRERLGSR